MSTLDINFFKSLLEQERNDIESVIENNNKEMKDLIVNDESNDEADHAFVNSNSTIRDAISVQQYRELDEVKLALKKITLGKFGVCEMCDEDIAIDRLKVKPYARYCIGCRGSVEEAAKKQ